jgi:hypothetical protein
MIAYMSNSNKITNFTTGVWQVIRAKKKHCHGFEIVKVKMQVKCKKQRKKGKSS